MSRALFVTILLLIYFHIALSADLSRYNGAKTEVFDIINKYAKKGLSILVISSELKEIVAIADRVIVLSNGLKTGEFMHEEITEDTLVLSSYKGHSTHKEEKEN